MRLTEHAITTIKNTDGLCTELAYKMKKTEYTIRLWIKENINDGFLTTKTAQLIIQEQTGLTDKELFESENVTA